MQNIDIQLKHSNRLTILFIVILTISFLCIISLSLLWLIKILLLFMTSVYGLCVFRSLYNLSEIRHLSKDSWHIVTRKKNLIGDLQGESTVTSFLCVLRFYIPEERLKRSFVILRDSMSHDDYRRLIVHLKCFRPLSKKPI